jgi:hypothetical protein
MHLITHGRGTSLRLLALTETVIPTVRDLPRLRLHRLVLLTISPRDGSRRRRSLRERTTTMSSSVLTVRNDPLLPETSGAIPLRLVVLDREPLELDT